MTKHRGEDIKLDEGHEFKEKGYTVRRDDGLIFRAGNRFGNAYSTSPDKALEDVKRNIDRHLDRP